MASEELAQKLQRRLQLEESGAEGDGGAAPAPAPASSAGEEERGSLTGSAGAELSAKLARRHDINEGAAQPRLAAVFNPYTEFKEFSRRQIKDMERMFRLYDSGRDGYIDLMELKLMMEKLGAPQTHLGLKNMIKEVDEDFDGKLSFRECFSTETPPGMPENSRKLQECGCQLEGDAEVFVFKQFLLIFHKAAAGELEEDSGLLTLAKLSEIDVSIEGVKGAKNFFEAKVQALSSASKFEAEIKAEQDERKREEEERKHRRAAFRELKSAFTQ